MVNVRDFGCPWGAKRKKKKVLPCTSQGSFPFALWVNTVPLSLLTVTSRTLEPLLAYLGRCQVLN